MLYITYRKKDAPGRCRRIVRRDDISVLLDKTGISLKSEHYLTPANLVKELNPFERLFFKTTFSKKLYRKIYRLLELELMIAMKDLVNVIESLNSCYRRLNKQRSVFPISQALMKALYWGTFEIAKKWTMPIRNWDKVRGELEIMYPDRMLI